VDGLQVSKVSRFTSQNWRSSFVPYRPCVPGLPKEPNLTIQTGRTIARVITNSIENKYRFLNFWPQKLMLADELLWLSLMLPLTFLPPWLTSESSNSWFTVLTIVVGVVSQWIAPDEQSDGNVASGEPMRVAQLQRQQGIRVVAQTPAQSDALPSRTSTQSGDTITHHAPSPEPDGTVH
jgi:hypothetical protein